MKAYALHIFCPIQAKSEILVGSRCTVQYSIVKSILDKEQQKLPHIIPF